MCAELFDIHGYPCCEPLRAKNIKPRARSVGIPFQWKSIFRACLVRRDERWAILDRCCGTGEMDNTRARHSANLSSAFMCNNGSEILAVLVMVLLRPPCGNELPAGIAEQSETS